MGEQICSYHLEIQIKGGKITENWGSNPPSGRSKKKIKIFWPFSFHFQIFHTKLHIFVFNLFLTSCFTNHISIKSNIFNMFYLVFK